MYNIRVLMDEHVYALSIRMYIFMCIYLWIGMYNI